jgi:NAD(P)-dependent dehydrogenase (short-subunit alcohol dehydrogenase family)
MPGEIDLDGSVFLITGGASGIGLAVAQLARQCGAKVAISDIDGHAAERAARELGPHALGIGVDVSREDECARAVTETASRFGKFTTLVNNAGVFEDFAVTTKQDLAAWRRLIDVNLQGAFLMARAAARAFPEGGGNSIVNVASVNGINGFRASNAYGVSKAGVIMLTKNLATDLAKRGIRVNAVAPGFVDTPMTERIFDGTALDRGMFLRRIPMARFGEPDEIARAIVFLASNWASYITGSVLSVDGGWHAFGGAGNASES